mgnify:CR=1 FL=1
MIQMLLLAYLMMPSALLAGDKSICGSWDDRRPSYDPRLARVQKKVAKSGCSLTLFGRACAITAGHCDKHFVEAHFNVPMSNKDGTINSSVSEDIYPVRFIIDSSADGKGKDFAVLMLGKNLLTNKLPGEVQGHYDISLERPKVGQYVTVTGYGADRDLGDETRNYTQQLGVGEVVPIETRVISYLADTWGGSSGSPIIIKNKVVGIHTHGNCESNDGVNSGSLISETPELMRAILACLAFER